MTGPAGIDPRGPRFAATITSVLLLAALVLNLVGLSEAPRALGPGFVLLLIIALLFLWGAAWPRTAPWGAIFRRFVRPRLSAPAELEDPRPPRFAQGVGLAVVGIGLVLHLIGVPLALPIATGAAFIAAFLNAAFSFCLGCQIYLLLQRAGVVGRRVPAV
ncbi:DUF4395 domain-containing protein [Microbacterium sp.]|uniref:DUF4395 domain-containing protein n=1 Tax=Microbacterium sp. TaxID=51671 RepID=UPI002C740BD5|nr:DUF4395 domain-containing protein [Microbacterium sp.]HWK77423.1 DUF4395 domain-containing protein [Microbacterium sp.]